MKDKAIVYFDMDGVLADFQSGVNALNLTVAESSRHKQARDFDDIPGIFALMLPTKGARIAVRELSKYYDVRVLTTAPWENATAWSDKLLWIKKYFDGVIEPDVNHPTGNPFHKKIVITHHKDQLRGAVLIDDRFISSNGASDFPGEKIWFRYPGNAEAQCADWLLVSDIKEVHNWY